MSSPSWVLTLSLFSSIAALALAHDGESCFGEHGEWVDSTIRVARSADGVPIQYRVYGQGELGVILIHGWSCDSSYWSAQFDALGQQHLVFAIDLAGHGESGRNRRDWTIRAFAADVAAVAQHIGDRPVVLVGHSLGGVVALEAADLLGDQVVGVITVDTFRDVGLPMMTEEQIGKFLAPYRRDFFGSARRIVLEENFPLTADRRLANRIADEMASAPPSVAIKTAEARFRHDFDSLLQRVNVPLVLINADYAGATHDDRIRSMSRGFRHTVILHDVGHYPMIEDPEGFNRVLLEEISSLRAGRLAAPPGRQ